MGSVRAASAAAMLIFAVGIAQAGEGIVWHTDLAKGAEIAAEKDLPMLVFLTSSHCSYCVKMKKQTLADGNVAAEINKRFVAVYVDRGSNPEFERRIGVRAYPTTVLLRADQVELARVTGYVSPQQLTASLDRAEAQHTAAKATAGTVK